MKARPVAIIWNDAHHIGADTWLDPVEIDPGVTVTTVGLLIRKTATHYVVAHSLDGSGNVTGVFAIPRANVAKVHRLAK